MPKPSALDNPSAAEGSIRDILSRLRAANDLDTAEVLASGLNTFHYALVRFRGDTAYTPSDITSLFELWEILLNLAKTKVTPLDFIPHGGVGKGRFGKPGDITPTDKDGAPLERRDP